MDAPNAGEWFNTSAEQAALEAAAERTSKEGPGRSLLCAMEQQDPVIASEWWALANTTIRLAIQAMPTKQLPANERRWALAAAKTLENILEDVCGR
jgi:hypothetical protein